MQYTDLWAQTNKRIHSLTCGEGSRPLHFLHANGLCAGTYLPFYDYFNTDFSILATDIPGHGDSDDHGVPLIRHWSIFVDDIRAAILAHSAPPVVGVGHSLGAVITLLAAAKYPDLFSHIVLMDPVIFPTWLLAVFKVTKWFHMTRFNPLAVGARRRKRVFASPEEAYRRFSSGRGMFATWSDDYIRAYCTHGLANNDDGTAVLKCNPETEAQIYESVLQDIWTYPSRVKCPTLIIRGGSSTTFLAGAASRLERKLKHGRLVTVPDTSHFVPMEKPEACHKAIMAFIGR